MPTETTFAEMGGDTMTLDPRTWGRGPQVLALTSIGTFLVSLDSSITTVAFRDIVGDFGESERQLLAWIFSGYNIAYAAGLLTAGRFADVYGRKKSFLRGLGQAHPLDQTPTKSMYFQQVLEAFLQTFI